MEPNTQNTPPAPIQQPPVATQPITQPVAETLIMPATPVQPPLPEKNSKMLFLIIAVLIITVAGIGGVFFLTNRQDNVQEAKIAAPIIPPVSPTPMPVEPTVPPVTKTPEQALQDVIIDDPATDMTDINDDLSQL